VLRLGNVVNEELKAKDVQLTQVLEKVSVKLHDESKRLGERRNILANRMISIQEQVKLIQNHRILVSKATSLQIEIDDINRQINALTSELISVEKRFSLLEQQLSSSGLGAFLLRIPRSIRRNNIQVELKTIKSKVEILVHKKNDLDETKSSVADEIRKSGFVADLPKLDEILTQANSESENTKESINALDMQIQSIQEEIDEIAEKVFLNIRVLGVTLSKICLGGVPENFRCDTLIIDELSTAPFPFVLVALALPAKRVVLFGDPKQLPPISVADTPTAEFWLRHDTYEIIRRHNIVETQLIEQQRMPRNVVELINHRMHDDKLRTPSGFEQSKSIEMEQIPFEGANVILVDTSTLNPWNGHDPGGSRYNLYTAEIVAEIIAQEIRTAIKASTIKQVGVICPFRAQRILIKKVCEARFKNPKFNEYIDLHTVDSFQGEE
jgi:superfamily I DNA and/or RNA helicase